MRIAPPIPSLVVMEHPGDQVRHLADVLENPSPDLWMPLDLSKLLSRQSARLLKNNFGHADLTHIMHKASQVKAVTFMRRQPQGAAEAD